MRRFSERKTWWFVSAVLLVLIALNFIRLPYFVQRPGAAQSMNDMVNVTGSYPVNGNYRLVYIYVGQANIYQYLWARFDGNPYTTLVAEKQVRLPDEDNAAYNLRQKNYMIGAQQSAVYVAYKAAGKNPKLIREGVLVLDVISSMPGAKVLKSGDRIIGAEGRNVRSIEELTPVIEGKRSGDRVALKIVRDKRERDVTVEVAPFPGQMSAARSSGIGIIQDNQFRVEASPPVHFDIENIGGPSAGLMMTLQIYDQLTRQDLSKDRDIAGTGTIELDGKVGPIGGIAEKVIGADRSGADIFFAPTAKKEAETARKVAKEIGTDMKIVPVTTFQDAVRYLQDN